MGARNAAETELKSHFVEDVVAHIATRLGQTPDHLDLDFRLPHGVDEVVMRAA